MAQLSPVALWQYRVTVSAGQLMKAASRRKFAPARSTVLRFGEVAEGLDRQDCLRRAVEIG
jgi:hypothetical protein